MRNVAYLVPLLPLASVNCRNAVTFAISAHDGHPLREQPRNAFEAPMSS